jgi:AcrR family transcriptional regulator
MMGWENAMGDDLIVTDRPRRVGRPDQQASEGILRHILETATRLFVEQGYAATSIEQIAAAAGSGKQTIYRRFESKAGLFKAVIDMRCRQLVALAEAAETKASDPLTALRETCWSLLGSLLDPDGLDIHRVLIAEGRRFPDLGDYAATTAGQMFEGVMTRLVRAAADRGQLRAHDPAQLVHVLMGVVTGWPVTKCLISQQVLASDAERRAFFDLAWDVFLRGAA